MLSDEDRHYLGDIAWDIDLAFSFMGELTEESFAANLKSFYAVTRCLEIVSEASRRLSSAFKAAYPEIPWRNVAGSGNIYRHDSEDVAQSVVWRTVQEALPALRAVVTKANAPTQDV